MAELSLWCEEPSAAKVESRHQQQRGLLALFRLIRFEKIVIWPKVLLDLTQTSLTLLRQSALYIDKI